MALMATPSTDRLLTMARDRSANGRLRLVENLVDIYLQPSQQLTDGEIADFGTFIDEVFTGEVPFDVRLLLADRGARAASLPPVIARRLANDVIDVAAPILKYSPRLTEGDLLKVIGLKKIPHMMAIAERETLSEAIADALVVTGNPEIVGMLLKNAGAKFTRHSIEKCIELARQIQALRLPLIQRPEFTAEDATKLMWWLPRELRRVIIERFGMVGGDNVIAKPANNNTDVASVAADMLARYQQTPPTEREAQLSAAWLADRNAITPALILQTMRMQQPVFCIALMARALRLPEAMLKKAIGTKNDPSAQLLAVFCRALQMDKAQFSSALILLNANDGREASPALVETAVAAFDRLTEMRAATMIKAWREDPSLMRARA